MTPVLLKTAEGFLAVVTPNVNSFEATVIDRTFPQCYQYYKVPVKFGVTRNNMDIDSIRADKFLARHIRLRQVGNQQILFIGRLGLYGGSENNTKNQHETHKKPTIQVATAAVVKKPREPFAVEHLYSSSNEHGLLVEIVSNSNVATNSVPLGTFRGRWQQIMEKFDWQQRKQLLHVLQDEQLSSGLSLYEINDILYIVYNSADDFETLLNMNSPCYQNLKKWWIKSIIGRLEGSDADMESLLAIVLDLPWNTLMIQQAFNIIGNSNSMKSVLIFLEYIKQEQASFPLVLRVLYNYSEYEDKQIDEFRIEIKNRLFTTKIEAHFPTIANTIYDRLGAFIQTEDLMEFLESFFDKQGHHIEQHVLEFEAILDNLQTFQCSSNVWKKVFNSLNDQFEPSEWPMLSHDEIVSNTFGRSCVYNDNELVDKIVLQSQDSEYLNRENLLADLRSIYIALNGQSVLSRERPVSQSPIAEWNESDIHQWAVFAKTSFSRLPQQEVLAVFKRAVELCHKFSPRPVQLLSLLIFLNYAPEKGSLQQMNTGEGKSVIVAMLAAIHALQGFRVDVVTTSTELSIPEVKRQRPFFEMLKLTVGENSQRDKKSAYECDIVYGTAADFQGDILRTEFLGNDCRGSRGHQVVIVDEVDSMLYDNRMQSVSIAAGGPGMTYLEAPLAVIWDFVNRTNRHMIHLSGKDYYISKDLVVEHESISLLSGGGWEAVAVKVEDRKNFIIKHGETYLRKLLRKLSEVEKIEYCNFKKLEWRISRKEEELSRAPEDKKDDLRQQCDTLRKEFQEHAWNKRHPIVDIPEHLRSFALAQVPKWITNAILALWFYKKDAHYTVINDCIVPISYNETGILQANMIWSDGLTQFLQLKEGLRMDPEGISTNFISNVSFFQRYGQKIYGMTGTLGEKSTQDFLRSMYDTDMIIIPPHKHIEVRDNEHSSYHCKELAPLVIPSLEKWYDAMVKAVLYHAQNQRGILVICKFISQAKNLHSRLKEHHEHDKIFLYVGEDKIFEKTIIDSGEIIIATNIAGRGTDLETTESVEKHGGMCVIITFLPESYRVEMQNVGRTARKGNRGMAQLIILDNSNLPIAELKSIRQTKEIETSAKAISDAKRILIQDALFNEFCQLENKYFPCVDDIQNMHIWNKLIISWNYFSAKYMDHRMVFEEWKICWQNVELEFRNNFEEKLTEEDRSKVTESDKQEMLDDHIAKARFNFEKNYKSDVRKRFCDENANVPGELLDCFKLKKQFRPKCNNSLTNINCSIYDRKGAEEVWGLWLKTKNITENEVTLEQAIESFSSEFAREFEDRAKHNSIINNPFYYVRKGNELLAEKDIAGAISCYDKAISMDQTFSLNARYNKAQALLTNPSNKSKQQEALAELDEAKKLIATVYQPNILIFNALITNGSSSLSTLQHIQHQLDIIIKHEEYIQGAEENIKEALEKGRNVTITLKKVQDVFAETRDNRDKAIHEAENNGLTHLFTVEEKLLIPWKDVIGLALIGMSQIVVGCLFYFLSTSSTVSKEVIIQGFTDIIAAVRAGITGNFSWSAWAVQKTTSVVLSIITAGITEAMTGLVALCNIVPGLFGDLTEACTMDSVEMSPESHDIAAAAAKDAVERAVNQLKIILAEGVVKDLTIDADSYYAYKISKNKSKKEISVEVVEKLTSAFSKNPTIVIALKDDVKHKSNFWGTKFVNEGFKLLENDNEIITRMLETIGGGAELLEGYTDIFLRQFEKKISEYETEINSQYAGGAVIDDLSTSHLNNINPSHMATHTQNIDMDSLNNVVPIAQETFCYTTKTLSHAKMLQSQFLEIPTPEALANAFKRKIVDILFDLMEKNTLDPGTEASSPGVEQVIGMCEEPINKVRNKMRNVQHDPNRLARGTAANLNIDEESAMETDICNHTKQVLKEISTGGFIHDSTIFALAAAAIDSAIYVYDDQEKLIDVKGNKLLGKPISVKHLPPSEQYPVGHFEPLGHNLKVTHTGKNTCVLDSVFAQLSSQQKTALKLDNPAALCDRVVNSS